MHPMKTIDLYASIAEASHHMVNAARASNWDALVDAEKECARRVAVLRAHRQLTQQQLAAAAGLSESVGVLTPRMDDSCAMKGPSLARLPGPRAARLLCGRVEKEKSCEGDAHFDACDGFWIGPRKVCP